MTPPVANNSLAPQHLLDLLKRQVGVFDRLTALSADQARKVEAGDADALLTLLAERQRQLDELAATNRLLEPYRARWEVFSAGLSAEEKGQVNSMLDRIQAMRDAVVQQDERDSRRLAEMRGHVGEELGRVNRGSRATIAYQGAAASERQSRFTDSRG